MPAPADQPEIILMSAHIGSLSDDLREELRAAGLNLIEPRSIDELRSAADSRLEVARAREDLLHLTVHNLKTPLTAIIASAEMLADGDLGPLAAPQAAAVRQVRQQADALLGLVESLLGIWRLEAPALSLSLEEIAGAELLETLRDDWSDRVARQGLRFDFTLESGAITIRGDRAVLRLVFDNLVQNALVHAVGATSLHVRVRRLGDNVLFTFTDDGPGVPLEFHQLIFEKFARVPHTGARAQRGSGLGLAFCRRAVEAHGGMIWVENGETRGSAFHVRLPAATDARTPVAGAE